MIGFKNLSMRLPLLHLSAASVLLLTVACGGGGGGGSPQVKDPSGKKDRSGNEVSKKAAEGFSAASTAFTTQEQGGAWGDADCKRVAAGYEQASKEQQAAGGKALPEALYNAGLAYQRCGDDANAKERFEEATNVDSSFHRARAQLALYKYKQNGNVEGAISELDRIIQDAKFQNVEGLVALAALQMVRNGKTAGTGCADDLACAKLNLQRALAIDDAFMPAFNQLALYYLEQARSEGGGKTKGALVASGSSKKKINKQRLDLAALVASQAQKKNPNYAPIHNTTGLILVELENYNMAVKSFGRAVQLNPRFFEAQMNYAAVNLSFRGYDEAAKAYRAALAMQPNTYEAHLGLALALRGGINDTNFQTNVAEAQKHLDEAKKLEPSRPEAFYNEAILAQEFRAKRAGDEAAQIAEFNKAKAQYQSFIQKASGRAEFDVAVKRSKDRVQDIEDTITFMEESARMAKEDAARQEAEKAAAAAAPPPPPEGAPPADGAAPPAGGATPPPAAPPK